jgi:hypothetical protein
VEPREWVIELERAPRVPPGVGERFSGYGVMSAPFRSGHVLAMRRFPASSLGQPYSSVWHCDPVGRWTIWTDGDPDHACPRYFGKALADSLLAPIAISWSGPRSFTVDVGEGELRWTVHLAPTVATRIVNALSLRMSEAAWRSETWLSGFERAAGTMLRAGRLRLHGRTPNGGRFEMSHLEVWAIRESAAVFGEEAEELGALGPPPVQLHLGDLWLPQRPLFAIGQASFERVLTPHPLRRAVVASSHLRL